MSIFQSESFLKAQVAVTAAQSSSDLAGETVILHVASGHYYGLSNVGSRAWQLMRSPIMVSEILTTLLGEYDVAKPQLEADLREILEDLSQKGLIEIKHEAVV